MRDVRYGPGDSSSLPAVRISSPRRLRSSSRQPELLIAWTIVLRGEGKGTAPAREKSNRRVQAGPAGPGTIRTPWQSPRGDHCTRTPAVWRRPRRSTSQPPGSRSASSGVQPSSPTLALFTDAPPSRTVRRAAPLLLARPLTTSRSTIVGRSGQEHRPGGRLRHSSVQRALVQLA